MRGTNERFWGKVDIKDADSCWEWVGNKYPNGYGQFWTKEGMKGAHKMSWELTNGPILNNLLVLHKCDNPGCVNPNHLYLGTQADNIRDRECRGPRTHGRPSRLGPEGIKKVRELWETGNYKQWQLAEMFNICRSYVSILVNHVYGDHTVKERPYK